MSQKIEALLKAANEAKRDYEAADRILSYADSPQGYEVTRVQELRQASVKAEAALKAALDEAAALAAEEANK